MISVFSHILSLTSKNFLNSSEKDKTWAHEATLENSEALLIISQYSELAHFYKGLKFDG
jgi:hypothetical protein